MGANDLAGLPAKQKGPTFVWVSSLKNSITWHNRRPGQNKYPAVGLSGVYKTVGGGQLRISSGKLSGERFDPVVLAQAVQHSSDLFLIHGPHSSQRFWPRRM